MHRIQIDGIEYRFFNHLYAVSHCGKALRKLQPYAPAIRPDGYLTLGRQVLMHRAVAICWIPNPENVKHVHHKNHIKSDNRADNLEWVSPKEHFGDRHSDTHGKQPMPLEAREKLRQVRLGSVTSEATKAKQRTALLGRKRPYFARKGHSEESKQRRRETHYRNTTCSIFGVVYPSFSAASRETGLKKMTIRKRCLSENFPDFKLVTS